MDKIAKKFRNGQPFIGYLTAGDGGLDYSLACAQALIEGGVDILEIGLPFSDPIADGPIIQRAHQRALENRTASAEVLEMIKQLKRLSDTPLVLFSYYNPLLRKQDQFLLKAKEAGIDAVLVVDLPVSIQPGAQDPFFQALERVELLPILLATPSTDSTRLAQIGKMAQGFVYYVSQKGTTGMRKDLAADFADHLSRLRPLIPVPIAAGFGIADQSAARAALAHADGFVVGSAFVKLMEEKRSPADLKALAQAIDPRSRKET
ncbi:tryptophan synthase subunit alpha [Candidatus Protochlamydia phocaeensis]|uniref:tryptophan synthase subunit alpha n=1 Tax=Candidatus Protochlamydia phocaeensis TaxID=1414722 RepID=UPI000837C9A7|nr:tryptophan synthase subunit alpha [Candidatus Protochlamydia phocaeensis]